MAEKSRRKLIKGLGISIPTVWAAPIIEAVILPAHAETTGRGETCSGSTTLPDETIDFVCNSGISSFKQFGVTENGDSLCLTVRDGDPGPGENQIGLFQNGPSNEVRVLVYEYNGNLNSVVYDKTGCPNLSQDPVQVNLTAGDQGQYTLQMDISVEAGQVLLSNIVLIV